MATIAATIFEDGNLSTLSIRVETSAASSPPKPLLIATPTESGTYPILVFFHGTSLRNFFYSNLLLHIASHGFIVVAPQLYSLMPPSGTAEVSNAAAVVNWLPTGLAASLPENVQPNLQKLALSGHSRGGNTAFALALGYASTALPFSALVGVGPVAGVSKFCLTKPHTLTFIPNSLDLGGIPVAVIGTGLGDEPANCLVPMSCAPDGVNHTEFFRECRPPCGHFVAAEYGHMDMLDDNPPGIFGKVSSCLCKNGTGARELMRRGVGGIVVAWLRAYLEAEAADLKAVVEDPSLAPVKLSPVEFIET